MRHNLTEAQRERQRKEHRDRVGRYSKVNPCYICERSAGVGHYSHPATDNGIADALLVLCERCATATETLDGFSALDWARGERARLGLAPDYSFDPDNIERLRSLERRRFREPEPSAVAVDGNV